MVKHTRAVKNLSKKQIRRKAKLAGYPEQIKKPDDGDMIGALHTDADHINAVQGAMLTDTRLPAAQRRALASQIEQMHGNMHLQRLVALSKNRYASGTADASGVQRQPDATSEATARPADPAQIRTAYEDLRRQGGPQLAAFHAEVDRRFWARWSYKVGERLDPNLTEDRPYVRLWLIIRNEVMAERLTSGATPSTGPQPVGPETRVTAFGTFDVYPDNFVGPLPRSDRAAGNWPVRQMIFNRIESVIESISGGSAGFKIEGTPTFKSGMLVDLAWLMTQPVGMELIEAIAATGKTLTYRATTGGNTTAYNPDADSWEIAGPPPRAGRGANVTIQYNTQEWNPYGGDEAWMRRPPAIGLAHEMVHAWTGMGGTRALGETGGVRRRELQASGLGEFANAIYTENRFRAAFGLPARPRY